MPPPPPQADLLFFFSKLSNSEHFQVFLKQHQIADMK